MVRGTFSPARAWRPAVGARLPSTLGQAVKLRRTPVLEAMVAAVPRRRYTVRARVTRSGCTQAPRKRPWPPRASQPRFKRTAIRGQHFSARATAVQFVVRASRGSAAPGSQLVVVRGARGCRGSGTSRGARTSQQPKCSAARYIALMSSRSTNSNSSGVQRAWPNPVFNRTPCGSPPLALISFWAKGGLQQGAG